MSFQISDLGIIKDLKIRKKRVKITYIGKFLPKGPLGKKFHFGQKVQKVSKVLDSYTERGSVFRLSHSKNQRKMSNIVNLPAQPRKNVAEVFDMESRVEKLTGRCAVLKN